METNTTYNLVNQLTQESKSLWRIRQVYLNEAETEDQKTFWKELATEKEATVEKLKNLIKQAL